MLKCLSFFLKACLLEVLKDKRILRLCTFHRRIFHNEHECRHWARARVDDSLKVGRPLLQTERPAQLESVESVLNLFHAAPFLKQSLANLFARFAARNENFDVQDLVHGLVRVILGMQKDFVVDRLETDGKAEKMTQITQNYRLTECPAASICRWRTRQRAVHLG